MSLVESMKLAALAKEIDSLRLQVAELTARLAVLEQKRGPGRPPKEQAA